MKAFRRLPSHGASMFQLHCLRLLIHLRYQLLRATLRHVRNRRAIIFTTSLAGGILLTLITLGSAETALIVRKLGYREVLARWLLLALFAGSVVISVQLGAGPNRIFSQTFLRRYPLTRLTRQITRCFLGLLDPIWLASLAAAVGLAWGTAVGAPAICRGSTAAALFVMICYLAAMLILSLIDRLLGRRGGAALLGAFSFLAFLGAGLAGPLLVVSDGRELWRIVDRWLQFLPPGAAASLMAGSQPRSQTLDFAALLAWCVILASGWAASESRPERGRPALKASVSWMSLYDRCTIFFGSHGPLVAKSLRYHLRCNRVRFNLAVTMPMVVILPILMGGRRGSDAVFAITLALFSYAGIGATHAIGLNQFGYDGSGIWRYLLLPIRLSDAANAGSIASLLVGMLTILTAIPFWMMVSGSAHDYLGSLQLLAAAFAGLLFFNALGLWTTVLSPLQVDFHSVAGSQQSPGGILVLMGGLMLVLGAAFVFDAAGWPISSPLRPWMFLSAIAASAILYVLSRRFAARALLAHREHLVQVIASPTRGRFK